MPRKFYNAAFAALLVATLAAPVAAQQGSNVSQSDIQRLQDSVYQAGNDVSQLRGRDSSRASQLQAELDDLRDEVIYLKVKLRKDPQNFARYEYAARAIDDVGRLVGGWLKTHASVQPALSHPMSEV